LPKQAEKTENGEDKETSTKSSIFGSAKPVDTAKKEAEIDQKLQETQTRVRTITLLQNGVMKKSDKRLKEEIAKKKEEIAKKKMIQKSQNLKWHRNPILLEPQKP